MKTKKLKITNTLSKIECSTLSTITKIDGRLYIDLGIVDDQYAEYSIDSYTDRDRYSDSEYGVIEIFGLRDETDAEYESRMQKLKLQKAEEKEKLKKQKESMEAMDRMMYEKLKAKFESK